MLSFSRIGRNRIGLAALPIERGAPRRASAVPRGDRCVGNYTRTDVSQKLGVAVENKRNAGANRPAPSTYSRGRFSWTNQNQITSGTNALASPFCGIFMGADVAGG